MASFHHHHHHCQNPVPSPISPISTTPITTCCCCHLNHSPPPIDPLLHSLTSLFHQQQQQQKHHQSSNLYSPYSNHQPHTHQNLHFQPQKLSFHHLLGEQQEDQETNFILSSLIQRINALESSLLHFNKHSRLSFSLKEAAAKVIQTHFRTFLVRRSRTLSQLQDLAFIKSSFNAIKSSVLNKTHLSYGVLSHKAMDLLLKLDSIQGSNPMIRDGKRSICRDIVRFLDFIDGLTVKRHGNASYKPVTNVRLVRSSAKSRALNSNFGYQDLSRNQKEIVEKLSERVEKIRGFSKVCDNDDEDVELEGFQEFIDDDDDEYEENLKVSKIRNGILIKSNGGKPPRVKKSVSFNEHGNAYRVFSETPESVLNGDGSFTDGSDSSDDHGEINSRVVENDEVVREENAAPASTQNSDGERNRIRSSRSSESYDSNWYCQDEEGNPVFSAPMPAKMESRADFNYMTRKNVKNVK